MAALNRRRELCLASVYALALTGVAGAADLTVKAPIVPPVPVFSWTGVYLGIGGGRLGDNEYSWNQDPTVASIGAQMGGAGPLPTPGATEGSVPIIGGFFGGNLEEIGRSSGPFSESRPMLIGLTSRAMAVASMQGYQPPRVSALPAMTRFRASAWLRVVSVQQLIGR